MRPWLKAVVVLVLFMGIAAHADDARPPSEASMLVTGTITLNGDGTVRSYTINHASRLSGVVIGVIQHNLPDWKFQPPEGHPDGVSGRMTLRMLSRPIDDKRDRVSIGGANFYDDPVDKAWHVTVKSRGMPNYPMAALRVRESGTVYLLLRVARDGHVQDAFAEQVNLDAYASKPLMSELRERFAHSALAAAKDWTFNVPTQGKTADYPCWYVRVPVTYVLLSKGEMPSDYESQWHAYVPGPRADVPWSDYHPATARRSDAMASTSVQEEGGSLQLLSSLEGE